MAIKDYGVWVAQPTSFKADGASDKTPHINLKFQDDSGRKNLSAAINVKSTDSDSRLVYWFDKDFTHSITSSLPNLKSGFNALSNDGSNDLALDFARTQPQLVVLSQGTILPYEASGPKNDILDDLEPVLTDAIQQKATIYVFGSSYGTGIHDIHMNQGSLPQFDNAVYSDGALVFAFPDGHWEAVFMAFASQELPTDDSTGEPLQDSTPLSETAHPVET